MEAKEVIKFWFEEIDSKKRWQKDPNFDLLIKERFEATLIAATKGELFKWRENAEGRLAEIIVLDQFSRNMYRDSPKAFAQDSLALILAQEAINVGADKELTDGQRAFLYMPFMHSESQIVHEVGIKLFDHPNLPLDFEKKHKVIIDQFGRYPHRNEILGRESTPEEIEFLKGPNSSF